MVDPQKGWSVRGQPDRQLVRSDWTPVDEIAIDGVVAKQITNVLTEDGYLTEIWRTDWALGSGGVDQVFQRVLEPGNRSAWHAHASTIDRLFCAVGRVRLSLYDGRSVSPTHGGSGVFRLGDERPAIVVVPAGVWHGVRNIGTGPAVFLNVVDRAYDYESPDHFRLPADTDLIPITL